MGTFEILMGFPVLTAGKPQGKFGLYGIPNLKKPLIFAITFISLAG